MLDCTYRVQIPHRSGQLAQVMGAIAEGKGLIGDVVTISVGRESSIREMAVEVRDIDQAERITRLIEALDGTRVIWHQDRALIRSEGGKLQIDAVHPVSSLQEMRDVASRRCAMIYAGVARVCTAIAEKAELARLYTMISRGDTEDVDEFIETVARIAPTSGGIHLEDISAPECFEIERRLIELLPQPVMHDDVHGTAVVSVAATIVACRHAGIELRAATVGQLGLGAAGFGIASLMVDARAKRVIAFDPQEASHARAREKGVEIRSMRDVSEEADVVVVTTGSPGLIEPSMVNRGQVILALSNPPPEIPPEQAEAAGAAFAGDRRSVNNVLGYPGIFRGALQAGAKEIDVEMKLSAAHAIADLTGGDELVPDALDQRVHDAVAAAVREAAERSGAARPELATVGL